MMSETRDSRTENTDFSITRILANDTLDTSVDVAWKRHEVSESDFPQQETKVGERTTHMDGERDSPSETHCDTPVITVERRQNDDNRDGENVMQRTDLTWLQYTRYRPPRLPKRSFTERRIKRRTSDHPRIPFSSSQLQVLEDRYRKSAYLSRNDVVEMSETLRLPQSKIKIWFQNRRARQRRELLNFTR